jgi:alkylation response protein AidB-like acyl-CoA dehydrogenase
MITDQARLNGLLARIRRFVREVAIPNEDRVEREDCVSVELVSEMKRLGSFGWSIPKVYGGSELTQEELALAFIEFTQCSVAYRVVGAQNAGIGSECLIRDGTPEQKQKYLPRLASGDLIGCLALTEESAGSDATALKTGATRLPNGDYVLNGSKRYITLAPIAGLFTVLARPTTVPAERRGYRRGKTWSSSHIGDRFATLTVWVSNSSKASFCANMTSAMGRRPSGMKHQNRVRRPLTFSSSTFIW